MFLTPLRNFFRRVELPMTRAQLHLVDTSGTAVCPEVETAVERSFHWVLRDYPQLDSAMIANWAEEVALSMQARVTTIVSPQRYAYAALKGKVHDWMRSAPAKEEVAGLGRDLERIGGLNGSFEGAVDRKILFEQLKATLNERDRYILVLLLEDNTSPATVAKALGTSYPAAAKAIQRVKERIASKLTGARKVGDPGHGSPQFCETKG
jgi:DNA-directed RNA polymerase specialized sigma24 family protein